VLGSCPRQLPPQSIKMLSRLMGRALIPPPSLHSIHRTMQTPSGILAWVEGLDSGPAFFMVYQSLFILRLGSADLLQKPSLAMPRLRLRMRPRRGSPWRPRRPHSSSSPSGSPTPGSRCTALVDSSWSQALCSPSDMHSSSPSPSPHDQPRRKPNTPSTFQQREHYAILQDLVFELRDGVNDVQFRIQQLEGRLSLLLQLLAPPPATPDPSSDSPENPNEKSQHVDGTAVSPEPRTALVWKEPLANSEGENDVAVSAAAAKEKEDERRGSCGIQGHADESNSATDMNWTVGATPITEEPWPGPMPEYVPDYTVLVPYFSSHGSK
jgi:hypothetical protein